MLTERGIGNAQNLLFLSNHLVSIVDIVYISRIRWNLRSAHCGKRGTSMGSKNLGGGGGGGYKDIGRIREKLKTCK